MIWYLTPILIGIFLYRYKSTKLSYYFIFFVFAFVYCSGYMTGSDWRGYEFFYNNASFFRFNEWDKDKGYYLLMLLFKKLDFSFFYFTILIKTLCLFSFFSFSKNILNSYKLSIFSLISLMTIQGVFLFVNCPFRNLIAISIFLFAFRRYYNKKFRNYLILMMLASSIHFSAFLILIITVLIKFFNNKIDNRLLFISYCISLVLSLLPDISLNILLFTKGISSFLDVKLEGYLSEIESKKFLSIGSIVNIIFFYILYRQKDIFKKNKLILYKISILGLIFYRLSMLVIIFSRFYLYFFMFLIIAITIILEKQNFNKYKVVWLTYSLLIMLLTINSNFAYLPYSNYWNYLIKDDLKSYYYRNNYNFNKWFEKHKKLPREK